IRVRSSDSGLAEKVRSLFLSQYEGQGSQWVVEDRPWDGAWLGRPSLLTTAEVGALAHLPADLEGCGELEVSSSKMKLPPKAYAESGITLGQSENRRETKTVRLPDEVRDRHVYIVGKTRTGKSTLLFNMARQDIEQGKG